MTKVISAFILSALLSTFATLWVIYFSRKFRLFDNQDIYRKTHVKLVSRLGGVAIFFGYFIITHLYADLNSISIHSVVAASSIIFFLGLKDDLLGGAFPYEKFTVQLLASCIIVIFNSENFKLDLLSSDVMFISWLLEFFLPVCLLLFIINAFNFIDGIDGLAGVLGVFVNVFIGTYLFNWGDEEFGISAFIIAGSTAGFLIYNLVPGKVFMGDSGAMLIGLMTGVLCLRFVNLSLSHNEVRFSSPVLIVCSLLIVPTFDVLRIFIIRAIHRKPLLTGDRNHIHHRLQDLGVRDLHAVLILIIFTAISLGVAIIGQAEGSVTIIFVLLLLCLLSNTVLSYFRGRRLVGSYKLSDVLFIDTFNRR
ncbi:MAG: MraY family glycosyltransferase [Flavobacterium sp.]